MLSSAVAVLSQALYTQYNNLRSDLINLFGGRQGGSATDWSTPGTSNYTPTVTPLIQAGVIGVTVGVGNKSVSQAVTFPVAFSQPPIVVASCLELNWSVLDDGPSAGAIDSTTTATGTTVYCQRSKTSDVSATQVQNVCWIAIGPSV